MASSSNRRRLAAQGAGALAAGITAAGAAVETAAAHHSYPATYDTNQRVILTGVVQLVRFSNPHVHIVIESTLAGQAPPPPLAPSPLPSGDATLDEGAQADTETSIPPSTASSPSPETTLWMLDMPAPNQALNMGLTPELLVTGTQVTVEAWPSRSAGSHDLAPLVVNLDTIGRSFRIRR